MKDKPCVFISYSRKDGFDFARNLRQKLEMLGFSLWQDVISLEGGRDFWLQITEALDNIEFMVLVLTDGAMQSPIVRKEWRYARQQGVCVYPVKGEPFSQDIHKSLPRWMRDAQYYDFDIEEQWQKFVSDLHKSCETVRVPFMVEDKPDDFVERPEEYNQLLALLLDPKREEPIAITAALRGAGGYGKTTLAKALCHDERIQNAFDDGILWVTLGENPGDLTGRVEDLIYTLGGERPGFSSMQAAAARLAELLADRDILLVIDDVWNSAHLTPFLQGGSRCSRLITTRNSDTLPAKAKGIDLDAMRPDEATSLLGFNLPEGENSELQRLAQRLGEWPLLLKLVNATLRYRVHDLQQSFAAAIAYVNAALDECGLMAFDQDNASERHQAVAKTLEVSLQMLAEGERQRYFELAIFPEDVNIPLATLEKLWSAAGYKPIHTEKLCEKLHKLSLLLHFDLSDRTIRLHDVMRHYLVQKLGADLPKLHERFLEAYRSATPIQNWANLPADEPYFWRHLAYHLVQSDQVETLRQLLSDYDWLQHKLAVCGVNALLADYDFFLQDAEFQLLQSALRLSANQLTSDQKQLSAHLLGRLMGETSERIQSLLAKASAKNKGPWLRPLTLSLTLPGGSLLRTLQGHTDMLRAVAITRDGQLAVSASRDGSLKVWNLQTGECCRTLEKHRYRVNAVAITTDAQFVVSASDDETLKVWNPRTGTCHLVLEGHHGGVRDVAITADAQFVVSASDDDTLKVWNLRTGTCHRTLEGHNSCVTAVALTLDGRFAVSASFDRTIKIWNLQTGICHCTLTGHSREIDDLTITPDGRLAVSASRDGTLKVWNLQTGECDRTMEEHRGSFTRVAITADGQFAVSAANDVTLKVWNLKTGACHRTLVGHNSSVTDVAVTPDGRLAVSTSEDQTLRVWNLQTLTSHRIQERHNDGVKAVALTHDGQFAVSTSSDHTLKVWNLQTGECCHTLEGHNDWVEAVALTHDGQFAVSTSEDHTLKVWNLQTGECCRTLEGHSSSVNAVALTFDGQLVVSASTDNTLKVWNLQTGECCRTLEGHKDDIRGVAIYMPDGQFVFANSVDSTHNLPTGASYRVSKRRNGQVNAVAITRNGQLVVSASSDYTIKVWNLQTAACHRTLEGHNGPVKSVAITPDGELVVSTSKDPVSEVQKRPNGEVTTVLSSSITLKVWNLRTGECCRTLERLVSSHNAVALTHDGQFVVSASMDNTIKVWNIHTGECCRTLEGHSSSVIAVALTHDGQFAVSTSQDHTLKVWNLASGEEIASFIGESPMLCCEITPDGRTIIAGDRHGRVHFLRLEGLDK